MLLNSSGRLFQSLYVKKDKLSVPYLEVRVFAIRIGKLFLRMWVISFCTNISFIKLGLTLCTVF